MNVSWTSMIPKAFKERFQRSPTLQKILGNIGWLLADKVLRMGIGLFVGIWVARYLGPDEFGLLSYAGAYVALFSTLATLGLDNIVVREITRTPEHKNEIIGTAFVLKLLGGISIFILAIAGVIMFRHGDQKIVLLVGIIATGAVFQVFDVIDFWFQAQIASKNTVYARNSAFVLLSAFKVLLIQLNAPLTFFALAGVTEIILGSIGLIIIYHRSGNSIIKLRWSRQWATKMLKDSWPMILSGVSIAIYMKIDQVMLAQMLDNKAVGIYSAAIGLSEVWYCIPMAVVSSVFPTIVLTKIEDEAVYYQRIQKLFSLMVVLSLCIAIPVSLMSSWLIPIVFGSAYNAAGSVLSIHVWASFFVFMGVAQGPWDITENMTRIALFRMVSGAIINIGLNFILIPSHGVIGAAIATVISQAFASMILNLVNVKTRKIFFLQIKSVLFYKYLRV
jgi:polysaccharide transporter, PST family